MSNQTSPAIYMRLSDLAQQHPDKPIFSFYQQDSHESLTGKQVFESVAPIAAMLQQRYPIGSRVLVLEKPGLSFIRAFHACLAAGLIAVPTAPPNQHKPEKTCDRLARILHDSGACAVLGSAALIDAVKPVLSPLLSGLSLDWLASDSIALPPSSDWQYPNINLNDIALLQYTSGSTGNPKGVMISHGNIMHNCGKIQARMDFSQDTVKVSWLPFFHDMGLFGNVLLPVYLGFSIHLMQSTAFTQKPLRWLEMISQHRASISGAPNFAYDLCCRRIDEEDKKQLDLSSWELAFNGAEPILPDTLKRFADAFACCGFKAESLYPCYGLAEASLIVTGAQRGEGSRFINFDRDSLQPGDTIIESNGNATSKLVSCGWVSRQALDNQSKVVITNSDTGEEVEDSVVGEICVAGGSVSKGYWKAEYATSQIYVNRQYRGDAQINTYLRTGDLGFIYDGELFVTGRLHDLLIVNGRNIYPQDLEKHIETALDSVATNGCAAFSEVESTVSNNAIILVAELAISAYRFFRNNDRDGIAVIKQECLIATREINESYGVALSKVIFIAPACLPKTTSGKVRRKLTRSQLADGCLSPIATMTADDLYSSVNANHRPATLFPENTARHSIAEKIQSIWQSVIGCTVQDFHATFFDVGGQSIHAGEIIELINEAFNTDLELIDVFDSPSIVALTEIVYKKYGKNG